jgi:hypothetical protein
MGYARAQDARSGILLLCSNDVESYKGPRPFLEEFNIIIENDARKAVRFFLQNDLDLVLLDHTADAPYLQLLDFFKSAKPLTPIIIRRLTLLPDSFLGRQGNRTLSGAAGIGV